MKLLFITQKIHEKDDDLAFTILWVKEFIKQGVDVEVICLEKGEFDDSFSVHSLGKEDGVGKIGRIIRFLKLITSLQYDAVFVHMNTEYFTLGGWYWWLTCKPMYLWYTHYVMHMHMRIAGWLSRYMFAATKQSLPQYEGSPKKIITGHGIDVDFWKSEQMIELENRSTTKLLTVHRICRSKRLELVIQTLKHLPDEYTLDIYGRDVEQDYADEMKSLVASEGLENRVTFHGPVPMEELKKVYGNYRLMVNMASETIDKTMLEVMLFGMYPVTTKGNSEAIGLPSSIEHDDPKEIAEYIMQGQWKQYDLQYLQKIVKENHSLPALIGKMNIYITSTE